MSFCEKLFAAAVLVLAAAGPAAAQEVLSGETFCVVDMQKVVTESAAGKAARESLEAELKESRAALDKQKRELQSMQDLIKRQAGVLSKKALEEKQEALRKKEREFQRRAADEGQEFGRRNNRYVAVIVREVQTVLAELTQQESCDFVMERGQYVVFAAERLDITNKVIQVLNKRKIEL